MNEEQKIIQKYFLPLAKNSESLQLSNDAAFINKKQNMVIYDLKKEKEIIIVIGFRNI